MSCKIPKMRYAVLALSLSISVGVGAQEISGSATTTGKAMTASPAVSQAMLDAAAQDAKSWIHPNGGYEQTRY